MPKIKPKLKPRSKSIFLLLVLLLMIIIIFVYFLQQPSYLSEQRALSLANAKVQRCKINFEEIKKVDFEVSENLYNFLKERACPEVEGYLKPNETVELWQAKSIIRKEPEGCNPSVQGSCTSLHYITALVGTMGEFVCGYVSQDNIKLLALEEVCGISPGINLLLKSSYREGENVSIKIINNLDIPIYLDVWDWQAKLIYLYKNGEWVEQKISEFCPCPCDCSFCPLCAPPMPRCTKLEPLDSFEYTWSQKILESDRINCTSGNTTFIKSCTRERQVENGRYKIMFCYYTTYEGRIEAYCKASGQARCVEKEFEIK